MRRRTGAVRHLPDFTSLPPVEGILLPRPSARMPRWLKVLLLAAGAAGLWGLTQLDYGTGRSVAARPPQPMATVEVAPPEVQQETPPEEVTVPTEPVTDVSQEDFSSSVPTVGILQDGASGGSGNGEAGLALDLGVAGSSGGMGVLTGGGGHGGGTGTGVGSGSGSGHAGTAARFVYNPGETDSDPRLVSAVDPVYPRRAREDGLEPRVELRILVSERGRAEQVEVMGAPAGYGFETALRNAVMQWHFQAATKGGVPVRTWVSQAYQFRLN